MAVSRGHGYQELHPFTATGLKVRNDVWPSDVDDVSEASVDKGLQLVGVVVLHVSEPYSKTDLTLVLKILILLWRERAEEFQMGRRVLNACLALLIRLLMSSSVPPSVLTTLPR